jgi:hypothetical protein
LVVAVAQSFGIGAYAHICVSHTQAQVIGCSVGAGGYGGAFLRVGYLWPAGLSVAFLFLRHSIVGAFVVPNIQR